MSKNLVIVESPAKVKTIKKYLGSNYEVMASNGHVRDLPKSSLGIDTQNGYEPKYITIRGKGDLLASLRKEVKKADKIFLATDPDREGEAISWHLIKALKLEESNKKIYRISFNEITKKAIQEAIKNPGNIDINLVNAQQTRRILDRIVGYKISPILWKKIKRGLSAGRVQSVALRMICDRNKEIEEFVAKEYWSVTALLKFGAFKPMTADFYGKSKKININNEEECDNIIAHVRDKEFIVSDIKKSLRVKKAPLPFTTSTLQQEAGKKLNFSTKKTMSLAQQLYEGVNIKGKGSTALITYLRTDSVRISDEAKEAAKKYIKENYGNEFISNSVRKTGNEKIQDAHEAIRPTDIYLTPVLVKESLTRDAFRLYQLIWKRFIACMMQDAVYNQTDIKISAGDYYFSMGGRSIKFPGFLNVYTDEEEETYSSDKQFDKICIGDKPKLNELKKQQHFTQPPSYFTEAALVKAMEEQGIGRPSTYAPTISTIINRRYVSRENKKLYVTELGQVVNNMMVEQFSDIVDKKFTANMENKLDSVSVGEIDWKKVIDNFYPDFEEAVKKAEEELENVKIEDEKSDVICELCGSNMVIKYGPHGKFLACPNFPECKNTKPYYEKTGVSCPSCGKDIVIKRSKKGRIYYGCINNPECDFMTWNKPDLKK